MSLPKISIIIPCYNIAKHLPKCVESILTQSFSDFELLLINDGSTDTTLEVCEDNSRKDTRIRVFSHDNKGVSFTRNVGLDNAIGDFIMFIDGDDFIKPDYLEKHLVTKEGDWNISGFINKDANNEIENTNFKKLLTAHPSLLLQQKEVLELLKYYSLSSPCCRVYRRSIINANNIRFREEVSYQEDLLFNLEYVKHIQNIALLNYFGYYYVKHADSSSNRFHPNFDYINEVFVEMKQYLTPSTDSEFLKRLIFDMIIKKNTNLFHRNSKLSKRSQIKSIGEMLNSDYFIFVKDYIKKSNINAVYRMLLLSNNKFLIYTFLKLRIR